MSVHTIQPGTIVYFSDEEGWFLLYKILKNESINRYFARCYWPSADEPTIENWQLSDLRTSCEEVIIPDDAILLTNETVSAEDELAIDNFLRIRTGIESRKTAWKLLLSQAEDLHNQQRYEEVITCCTECASFVKYEARVFQLRGYALLQLERYSEAIADLEHALTIEPGHIETLVNYVLALVKSGKQDVAKRKVSAVLVNETDAAIRERLEKVLSAD